MEINFLPSKFPAGDVTDGQYLYRSLGSFWTQLFQDKQALKGYTLGMADELIQSYYKLTETVKQYSIKEIPVLNKERWQPITIRKSEFDRVPFLFEADGAVFGRQPSTDLLYADQIFRFGFPKEGASNTIFSYKPTLKIKKFGLISNRIIAPSLLLLPGAELLLKNDVIYFNVDIFNNSYIPKAKVISEAGVPVTYQDVEGRTHEDEFVVLWMYQAEIDNSELYKNFGVLFDLRLSSSESSKEILKSIINLAVEGPTIAALSAAVASFAGAPIIVESSETVETMYSDERYNYIITDKTAYRIPITEAVSDLVFEGAVLYAGEILTDSVKVVDSITTPGWWQRELSANKLAFASHVFAANTRHQLFFENITTRIRYTRSTGRLTFPVLGSPDDVQSFQDYINIPKHKDELLLKLGINPNSDDELQVNPVDFVFSNFFKGGTLLLKLEFFSADKLEAFFNLFSVLQPYLPSHVYLMIYINLELPADVLGSLNTGIKIADYPAQIFSSDGSVVSTGSRPGSAQTDLNYYKDYLNRMFCVAVGPYKSGQPLHADGTAKFDEVLNLDELAAGTYIKAGTLRTEIPEHIIPPGESTPRRPSTREIPTILLLDF
jgi:hypothetical protein